MSLETGSKNSILDIPSLRVGHAQDTAVKTGVTVLLPDAPVTCAVDVRGGGPGTRETDTLQDGGLIDQVHAIVLSGGSVYGLAAADGVTSWLGQKRIGYAPGPEPVPVSPIVPSAILFDNANGGDKNWGEEPPFRALGIAACEAASRDMLEGGHRRRIWRNRRPLPRRLGYSIGNSRRHHRQRINRGQSSRIALYAGQQMFLGLAL